MSGDPFAEPFDRPALMGWFVWTPAMTADFDSDSLFHRCHIGDLEAVDNAGHITTRSPVVVLRGDDQHWNGTGIYLHLNVMQRSPFGPVEIALPIKALEGRKLYAFRRSPRGTRYLYLMQHGGDQPLFDAAEPEITDPLETLFTKQSNGKYDRQIDERVVVVLTAPVALTGAQIVPIAHEQCRARTCADMTTEEGRALLKKYFDEHPSSALRAVAKL